MRWAVTLRVWSKSGTDRRAGQETYAVKLLRMGDPLTYRATSRGFPRMIEHALPAALCTRAQRSERYIAARDLLTHPWQARRISGLREPDDASREWVERGQKQDVFVEWRP